MPGLAKVGRTTRDPTTRAGELSSATGVASPFILAYSQPVNDCISAERWVHSQLENAGFRHASNREFFNAPLHEIVPIVFGAAQHCIESTDSDGRADTDSDDIVHGLRTMAEHYRDGEGVLVNKHKALELFEQAAQFGDGMSAVAGGMLAQYGGGNLRPDLEKALTMYRVAVRQGDWWVNAYIAELFMEAGQANTANDSWTEYFQQAVSNLSQLEVAPDVVLSIVANSGCQYPYACACGQLKPTVTSNLIEPFAEALIEALKVRAAAEPKALPWHLKGKNLLAIRVIREDILGGPSQR
jgi:hypothetical protein